jgi:hypothetical protein
MIYCIDICLV